MVPTPNQVCRLKSAHEYNRMPWPHTHTKEKKPRSRNKYFQGVNRLKDTQASLHDSSSEGYGTVLKLLKWEALNSVLQGFCACVLGWWSLRGHAAQIVSLLTSTSLQCS